MPDLIVQHVDGQLDERIKALARHLQCSVNDVLLASLRRGLSMFATRACSERERDPLSLQILDEDWGTAERVAFQEALQALVDTCPTALAPERNRYQEPDPDAQ